MLKFRNEEEVVEAAERIQRREYWDDVRQIAKDAIGTHPGDEEGQDTYVHESVDGSQWVIYTRRNLYVLLFTDHDDAYEDIGEIPTKDGASGVYQFLAFFAMRADVVDELERLRDEVEDEEQ